MRWASDDNGLKIARRIDCSGSGNTEHVAAVSASSYVLQHMITLTLFKRTF
jgi:hypothetical protein